MVIPSTTGSFSPRSLSGLFSSHFILLMFFFLFWSSNGWWKYPVVYSGCLV